MISGAAAYGGLTQAEMQARLAEHRQQLFNAADEDRNGSVSFGEFEEAISDTPIASIAESNGRSTQDLFAKLDQNGDGSISQAEFDQSKPPQFSFASQMLATLLNAQEAGGAGAENPLLELLQSDNSDEDSGSASSNDPYDELYDAFFGPEEAA